MAKEIKKHLQRDNERTHCGRSMKLCKVTNFINVVTCYGCEKHYMNEIKYHGVYKFYDAEKQSVVEKTLDSKRRSCLKCNKRFLPKSKFNFLCGCLTKLDLEYDIPDHRVMG